MVASAISLSTLLTCLIDISPWEKKRIRAVGPVI